MLVHRFFRLKYAEKCPTVRAVRDRKFDARRAPELQLTRIGRSSPFTRRRAPLLTIGKPRYAASSSTTTICFAAAARFTSSRSSTPCVLVLCWSTDSFG